jgi:hypothetical protein
MSNAPHIDIVVKWTQLTICSAAKLPEWMSAEEGKEWETQVWEQVAKEVERIQPGSLSWVPGN